MKDLSIYTDDELREELKRRAMERRKNTPREILYVEFEATIKYVDKYANRPRKSKVQTTMFLEIQSKGL